MFEAICVWVYKGCTLPLLIHFSLLPITYHLNSVRCFSEK